MSFIRARALVALACIGISLSAVGCGDKQRRPEIVSAPVSPIVEQDGHSYGNPEQIRVRHLSLNLVVDLFTQDIHGQAGLRIERQKGCPPDAKLILDSKGLEIDEVMAGKVGANYLDWSNVPFDLAAFDKILGSKLTIAVPVDADAVVISYRVPKDAGALLWLNDPSGKRYVFTQSECTLARTWIPLQDSPQCRLTYDARIEVVPGSTNALMSAERVGRMQPNVFHFRMPHSIPPYLIALAVGDVGFAPLGPGTGVYADPDVLRAAEWEFASINKMLKAMESICGPYHWGRYDLLVLPPGFPIGGMENPTLTFVSPTIIAGDRSLDYVNAHEIGHSWAGNLVTNATWRDFWLNEGLTTYLELRNVEAVYGRQMAQMQMVLGMDELQELLKELKEQDQILHVNLTGRDPNNDLTEVAYWKGCFFFMALEDVVGRERMDAFLKRYFNEFAFQSITTPMFEQYVSKTLLHADEVNRINLKRWFYEPGLPPHRALHSTLFDKVEQSAKRWVNGQISAKNLGGQAWSTQEWLRFFHVLPEKLSAAQMRELDAAYGLTERQNAEMSMQWLALAVRSGYAPADARLESFITKTGRRRLIVPLYRELVKTPEGKARARSLFAQGKSGYHRLTADGIKKLVD